MRLRGLGDWKCALGGCPYGCLVSLYVRTVKTSSGATAVQMVYSSHHGSRLYRSHPSIVFAALAISRWIEARTGWSIKKFVRTACRYRTSKSRPTTTPFPQPPLPADLRGVLDRIHRKPNAH